jgi:lysophospholipase L1-like esterase
MNRKMGWTAGLVLLVSAVSAMVSLASVSEAKGEKAVRSKVRIVLVGDSTVTDSSGWAPGFKQRLQPEAECLNWAKGGRSSRSFIDEGWWQKALAERPDYVLIQFGHNDQPGKGPERETEPETTYREFMTRYVDEARAAGAKPILVTSMTRRRFGPDGKIRSDLQPYAEAVRKLAAEKNVPLIDLHALSIDLLNRLGPQQSAAFDPQPKPDPAQPAPTTPVSRDRTHLSPIGAEAMGKLVADELKKVVPELAPYIQ